MNIHVSPRWWRRFFKFLMCQNGRLNVLGMTFVGSLKLDQEIRIESLLRFLVRFPLR